MAWPGRPGATPAAAATTAPLLRVLRPLPRVAHHQSPQAMTGLAALAAYLVMAWAALVWLWLR